MNAQTLRKQHNTTQDPRQLSPTKGCSQVEFDIPHIFYRRDALQLYYVEATQLHTYMYYVLGGYTIMSLAEFNARLCTQATAFNPGSYYVCKTEVVCKLYTCMFGQN